MRQLHELLWYLTKALTLQPARPIHDALSLALDETERLTHPGPDSIMELDVTARRADINIIFIDRNIPQMVYYKCEYGNYNSKRNKAA